MPSIKKLVELDYPSNLVTEPALSRMIKEYPVEVSIRRANITKGFGYVQMEISGDEKSVENALDSLAQKGIDVNPIVKDIVE